MEIGKKNYIVKFKNIFKKNSKKISRILKHELANNQNSIQYIFISAYDYILMTKSNMIKINKKNLNIEIRNTDSAEDGITHDFHPHKPSLLNTLFSASLEGTGISMIDYNLKKIFELKAKKNTDIQGSYFLSYIKRRHPQIDQFSIFFNMRRVLLYQNRMNRIILKADVHLDTSFTPSFKEFLNLYLKSLRSEDQFVDICYSGVHTLEVQDPDDRIEFYVENSCWRKRKCFFTRLENETVDEIKENGELIDDLWVRDFKAHVECLYVLKKFGEIILVFLFKGRNCTHENIQCKQKLFF